MGYYVETCDSSGKVQWLIDNHDAEIIDQLEADVRVLAGLGVVCVVTNPTFEAAGFCYCIEEFDRFANFDDLRPKVWLSMDRVKLEELSDYTPVEATN